MNAPPRSVPVRRGPAFTAGRLVGAVALGSVFCALTLPVLSADDPAHRLPWVAVTAVQTAASADAQAEALLAQRQAHAEVELLLAEAMWGEVPAHLYDRHLVGIERGGWMRLAWIDPTGRQAPQWVEADARCGGGDA